MHALSDGACRLRSRRDDRGPTARTHMRAQFRDCLVEHSSSDAPRPDPWLDQLEVAHGDVIDTRWSCGSKYRCRRWPAARAVSLRVTRQAPAARTASLSGHAVTVERLHAELFNRELSQSHLPTSIGGVMLLAEPPTVMEGGAVLGLAPPYGRVSPSSVPSPLREG